MHNDLEGNNLIYVTGDTHGELSCFDNPLIRKLKRKDSLIICGDFGFLWDNTEDERKNLKYLSKRRYQILFVDGTHENFDLLNSYPIVDYKGGKARKISNNIYYLMRGQIYEIDGKTVFAFGGGESPEKELRMQMGKWWKQEMPTLSEMRDAFENLKKHGLKVDYVISHEPSAYVRNMIDHKSDINSVAAFFDGLEKNITFTKWFFGSQHIDRKITSKHYALFDSVIPVEPKKKRK